MKKSVNEFGNVNQFTLTLWQEIQGNKKLGVKMKTLFFALIVMFVSCSKEQQDCSQMTTCTRTYYTYSTCTQGEYDNIYEKKSISRISVCDTLKWHSDIEVAELNLYNASGEDFQNFMKLYPSKCSCE